MLDEVHGNPPQPSTDHNVYHLGSISGHNIVITGITQARNVIAATVITQMQITFPNIHFGLLVGIRGGVPIIIKEGIIQLEHIMISKPIGLYSNTIQYDHRKAKTNKFIRIGALIPPPPVLLQATQALNVQCVRSDNNPLLKNIQHINTTKKGLHHFQFPGFKRDYLFPAKYTLYPCSTRGVI
ncbi:uncharacterized protein TRUGW13939_02736 [Talaromyces rugulosus]|uniref:Nucleoside phosphorylase domain-containing protein n=1 Tax=Talaromyces rugulosus TaxID=121627 RepID=A0A7H8QP50_TALRU|nr:uncharacterized protein TRUGW13939_02736 [Talaromyces rugulosus]QKX55639.1 hypothetical protein TRUGW13939_02736 [Talaromyces rugulosus]